LYHLCFQVSCYVHFSILLTITYIVVNPGSIAFQETQGSLKKDNEDAGVRKAVAREGI
jgi:hypothetical protein